MIYAVRYEARAPHVKLAFGKYMGPVVNKAYSCSALIVRPIIRQCVANWLQMIVIRRSRARTGTIRSLPGAPGSTRPDPV